jgi:hypothetical protein
VGIGLANPLTLVRPGVPILGVVIEDSTFLGDPAGILLSKVSCESPGFGLNVADSPAGGMNGRVLSNQEI